MSPCPYIVTLRFNEVKGQWGHWDGKGYTALTPFFSTSPTHPQAGLNCGSTNLTIVLRLDPLCAWVVLSSSVPIAINEAPPCVTTGRCTMFFLTPLPRVIHHVYESNHLWQIVSVTGSLKQMKKPSPIPSLSPRPHEKAHNLPRNCTFTALVNVSDLCPQFYYLLPVFRLSTYFLIFY